MKFNLNYRIFIIDKCVNSNLSTRIAAQKLHLSERRIKQLKKVYKENNTLFAHGNKNKKPINKTNDGLISSILEIRKLDGYSESNFSHFTDLLKDYNNIDVSYSTVYRILKANNYISPRKHKQKKIHRRRKPKETFGKMLQTDATPHEFFKGNKKKYSLHGFIDDCTGVITGLYLCENECLQGYFEITRQTLLNFGIPESIYADGSNVFFNSSKELTLEEQLNGKKNNTQYGNIADYLGIELIHARSAQAKGKIERLWNTLHDRLTIEFQINNITNINEANKFLPKFIKKYNRKFALDINNFDSSFVTFSKNDINLDILLSSKFDRICDSSNTISLNSKKFIVDTKEILHKEHVQIIINKKIGMKALYKDKLYKLIPIDTKNIDYIKNTSSSVDKIIQDFIFVNCLKSVKD